MLHTLGFFFSSKCHLFHNATFFVFCIIRTLHTGCAQIYMPNSGVKRLTCTNSTYCPQSVCGCVLCGSENKQRLSPFNRTAFTVDPPVTTGLTYKQLGCYDPHAGQGHLSYDPHGVRKLQSKPRYACLWT
jgi:hypothetical protein